MECENDPKEVELLLNMRRIRSSTFINLHRNRTTTIKDELVVFKRSIDLGSFEIQNVLSFLSSDADDNNIKPISPDICVPPLPCRYGRHYYEIVGPINGLIAFTNSEIIILFNPATRNYMVVPPSPYIRPPHFLRSLKDGIGFGYNVKGKDYKLVKISEIYKDPHKVWDDYEDRVDKVEIYSLRENSWKELDFPAMPPRELPDVHSFPCFQIFYNGAFHWYAYIEETAVKSERGILCLDMSTEVFLTMKLPHTCHHWDGRAYSFMILNEALTLICYVGEKRRVDPTKDMTDIWVVKDHGTVNESWVKMCTVRPLYIDYRWRPGRVICCFFKVLVDI